MNKLGKLTRAYTLFMSVTPFFIALCCAEHIQGKSPYGVLANGIVALIGILCVHMATNLFDDYIDIKSQLKKGLQMHQINFNNKIKASLILSGEYSMKQVEKILISLVSVAFLIGLYFIISCHSLIILSYMVIAAVLSVFYPFSSKYGLSELVIGIVFGPLLIGGVYYALTGQMDPQVFNISIASGLLTVILALTHSIMDYEHDAAAGKKTIPVLLKDKNLSINLIAVMIIIAYVILFYTYSKYSMHPLFLLAIVLSIPVGKKLVCSLYDYIQIKDVPFIPKWYLGKMENWNEIKEKGLAYFMYRFYMARNLAAIFNLAIAIVGLYCFTPVSALDYGFFRFITQYIVF